MLRYESEESSVIEEWLSEKAGRKVSLVTPKKGEKLRFVEMAEENSKITLQNELNQKESVLLTLKQELGLKILPRKIESYDISNISGTDIVAGMIVLQDGKIRKNLGRIFKIKTVYGQDDPKCMEEVITRRLMHKEQEKNPFGELPDVIFVDGGVTQINAAKRAMEVADTYLPVYGMVKDNRHRTKALLDENRVEIELSEKTKNLITNMQDAVHDKAINYHRKLRDKKMKKSELDNIKGIGPKKKQILLKEFGSVEKIREATIDELVKVDGINEELAKLIKDDL